MLVYWLQIFSKRIKPNITYPFWATCPQFPQVGLFIAVLSAFFYTGRSCTLFGSIFYAFKPSVTVALHVLWDLPLPFKPSICKWVHLFMHLSLFSTSPYHVRRFKLSFDSKGARFSRPYIVDRLTLSAFIFSIQRNIASSLRKRRCISSLLRGQHLLEWSKVSLAQLSYSFPCLAKDIVVDVRRGSSSRDFPHAALVVAILASSQPLSGQILSPR